MIVGEPQTYEDSASRRQCMKPPAVAVPKFDGSVNAKYDYDHSPTKEAKQRTENEPAAHIWKFVSLSVCHSFIRYKVTCFSF